MGLTLAAQSWNSNSLPWHIHPVTQTSSRQDRGAAKRQRLVDAAWQLYYERGLARATLMEIAQAAEVPIGNVYYYFPTKDDLTAAVLEAHKQHIVRVTRAWAADAADNPAHGLHIYVQAQADNAEKIALEGCHHSRLAYDLAQEPAFRHRAREILDIYLQFAARQIGLMGLTSNAHALAQELIGRVQGGIALASTLRAPSILVAETQRLHHWIDDLNTQPRTALTPRPSPLPAPRPADC
jgi:AcrR family transcriptional regulator